MICYRPIASIEAASTCDACQHQSLAHTNDGPCTMCWAYDKLVALKARIDDAIERERARQG